jgi:6,7-dimethyl-8-ribityllumazine synthase
MAVVPINRTPSPLDGHAKLVEVEAKDKVKINPGMLELLRDTITLAEKGLVDSIVINGVLINGDAYRGWNLCKETSDPYKLMGVVQATTMEFAIATALISQNYEDDTDGY